MLTNGSAFLLLEYLADIQPRTSCKISDIPPAKQSTTIPPDATAIFAEPNQELQESCLFALPPELRNRIYQYVLTDEDEGIIDIPPSGRLPRPPLLKVNRQITS